MLCKYLYCWLDGDSFFAGLAIEALAQFFDQGVEAATVFVGFGVAVDLESSGKGVAADDIESESGFRQKAPGAF
ncbi:MAG: hypothetical protein WA939_18210 [Nodosilinea sp.]